MRNCVSNGVRTSRCRADFFRLSKSRCGLPSRRAPDRLAALLTAFRLIYRVLPTPGFHRWERPSMEPPAGIKPASTDYKTVALPLELWRHIKGAAVARVAPCASCKQIKYLRTTEIVLLFLRQNCVLLQLRRNLYRIRGLPRLLVLHIGLAPLPRRSLRNAAPLPY